MMATNSKNKDFNKEFNNLSYSLLVVVVVVVVMKMMMTTTTTTNTTTTITIRYVHN